MKQSERSAETRSITPTFRMARGDYVSRVQPARARGKLKLKRKNYIAIIKIHRDVAHLVARVVWDHDVAGSNPVIPTKNKRSTLCVPLIFVLGWCGENLLLR